eukprot:Platyproteum_vivax@DN12334_c0_g1_i1.p1
MGRASNQVGPLLTRFVGDRQPVTVMRKMMKMSRVSKVSQRMELTSRHERLTWRRVRIPRNQVFDKKFQFLIYCNSVIKYAINNNLYLGGPRNKYEDHRLVLLKSAEAKTYDALKMEHEHSVPAYFDAVELGNIFEDYRDRAEEFGDTSTLHH